LNVIPSGARDLLSLFCFLFSAFSFLLSLFCFLPSASAFHKTGGPEMGNWRLLTWHRGENITAAIFEKAQCGERVGAPGLVLKPGSWVADFPVQPNSLVHWDLPVHEASDAEGIATLLRQGDLPG